MLCFDVLRYAMPCHGCCATRHHAMLCHQYHDTHIVIPLCMLNIHVVNGYGMYYTRARTTCRSNGIVVRMTRHDAYTHTSLRDQDIMILFSIIIIIIVIILMRTFIIIVTINIIICIIIVISSSSSRRTSTPTSSGWPRWAPRASTPARRRSSAASLNTTQKLSKQFNTNNNNNC